MPQNQPSDLHPYPTKDQILQNQPKLDEEIVKTLKDWKNNTWKKIRRESEEIRFNAIKGLLIQLADMMGKGPVNVEYRPNLDTCAYQGATQTIFINKTLSIISALHELGHHLHGSSELLACSLSVHLFKAAFPKAFAKLEWKGHMLIKADHSAKIQ